jgi:hypothetical protein
MQNKDLAIDPCSIVLHPTNKDVFALMLAKDRIIQYRDSQGVLLAEQKNSFAEENEESHFYDKHLSFSPDGTRLAAVFPKEEEIVIFNVPLRVQIEPKKLMFILLCLKNQKILPQDVVGLLFDIFTL